MPSQPLARAQSECELYKGATAGLEPALLSARGAISSGAREYRRPPPSLEFHLAPHSRCSAVPTSRELQQVPNLHNADAVRIRFESWHPPARDGTGDANARTSRLW